jgi:hypothetical protein
MTAKIIPFTHAKHSRELQEITRSHQRCQSLYASEEYFDLFYEEKSFYKEQFNKEYTELISSLKTKNVKYRMPTVMSGYRKDINPVDALYQNLQEALFCFDKEDKFYMWIICLFKEKLWLDNLLADLTSDCEAISIFQKSNSKNKYNVGLNELHILQNIKSNFAHYKKTFAMMRNYTT